MLDGGNEMNLVSQRVFSLYLRLVHINELHTRHKNVIVVSPKRRTQKLFIV